MTTPKEYNVSDEEMKKWTDEILITMKDDKNDDNNDDDATGEPSQEIIPDKEYTFSNDDIEKLGNGGLEL